MKKMILLATVAFSLAAAPIFASNVGNRADLASLDRTDGVLASVDYQPGALASIDRTDGVLASVDYQPGALAAIDRTDGVLA